MIAQHTDSPAPLQAAEQRGVYAFGQASDMRAFAPRAHLTAIVDDWSGYYIKRVGEVMDGTWKSGAVWGGIKDGFVRMAPYNETMTPEARKAADEVKDAIVSGKLHPFTGELKDQKGVVRLKAGETASDEMLSKMDWYVDGIQA
jgi:simple sugar transport system substrate-binding protein